MIYGRDLGSFILDVWQRSWNDPLNQENKLLAIKPNISEWLTVKPSRGNCFGPFGNRSYINDALISSQRRRAS